MLLNGCRKILHLEIDSSVNGRQIHVNFHFCKFEIKIGNLERKLIVPEIEKHMKLRVNSEGESIPLQLSRDHNHYGPVWEHNVHLYYRNIEFVYPEQESSYPTLDLEYTGDIKVKKKSYHLKMNPDTKKYKLRFR